MQCVNCNGRILEDVEKCEKCGAQVVTSECIESDSLGQASTQPVHPGHAQPIGEFAEDGASEGRSLS